MILFTANDLHFHDGASTADVIAGDVFFEILDPPELQFSYRIRPAKDFGIPFVSNLCKTNKYVIYSTIWFITIIYLLNSGN